MLKKKISIYFNHERLYIAENGVIVLNIPSCITRKKSRRGVLNSFGDEAFMKRNILEQNELFSRPVDFGKINDLLSAKLLFKAAIKTVYINNPFIDINVLVPSGISKEDIWDIKNTFISIGYNNITFTQVGDILGKFLYQNNKHFSIFFDIDTSEIVFTNNYSDTVPYSLAGAYSSNISLLNLAQKIKDYLLNKLNFNTSMENIMKVIDKNISFFENDTSIIKLSGFDSITDTKKDIQILASELYPIISELLINLIKFFIKATSTTDFNFLKKIIKNEGIVCLGDGCSISGFDEFIYKQLSVGCIKEPISQTLLIFLSTTYANDEEWIFNNSLS
ncbi:MAG: rod shape-determining protein [Clostridia bacterium]|nr:rod shape-determining protein [Clostridia bacterium]